MPTNELASNRTLWQSCLMGFLLDERSFSPRRLQIILSAARAVFKSWVEMENFLSFTFKWKRIVSMRAPTAPGLFKVLCYHVFTGDQIWDCIILRVIDVVIWIQVWGLPIGYHNLNFSEYIGAMVSPVEWVDWPNGFPRNLRFLRIRVQIQP